MNEITSASAPIIAVFESAQSIRIILLDDEPWFCVADVCDVLGYVNSRKALSDHCRSQGVTKRYTLTSKGNQELSYINEGNLYRLVIKSRKPEAEKFETWVCDEALPSIRKTGSYSLPIAQEDYREAELITEAEVEKIKRYTRGIASCLPTIPANTVAVSIYGRIKSPLRIGRIDDLPAPYFDRTMKYLERLCAESRKHHLQTSAIEADLLSRMTAGCEVAA